MLAMPKTANRKMQKCLKPHGTSGFRHYGAKGHCIKDGMNIAPRSNRGFSILKKASEEKSSEALSFLAERVGFEPTAAHHCT